MNNADDLAQFIAARSARAAQSALYGYIKTRAGFEYFRLFEDDQFLRSVNIAKWNLFAVCVGDLAVFCGAHLRRQLRIPPNQTAAIMERAVARVFAEAPNPPDAGPDYPRLADETLLRIRNTPWTTVADDESCFARSPDALVYWAPVADALKQHDAEIVRNSLTFMWKEIRDQFRRQAHPAGLRKAATTA